MKVTDSNVTKVNKAEVDGVEAPLYDVQPAAGFPTPGDDVVERPLNLNDLMIDNETATFFVRVSGDSMEGKRIFDGDVLVVDRSVPAEHLSIVVAAVYGELVVKQLYKTSSQSKLVSAKEGYAPIPIGDADDVHVWGVVTGTLRRLV